MIIVKIKAGLGNQLFQYACGRALSLRNKDELKLDLSNWSSGKEVHRSYGLNNFKIIENVATDKEVYNIRYPYGLYLTKMLNKARSLIKNNNNISYNPAIMKKGDVYLDGFWQSELYFKDQEATIRKELQPKNPLSIKASAMLEKIKSDPTAISVHVRRGDNAHNPASMKAFGCPGTEYYLEGIEMISCKLNELIHLYVFSDEIDWAKNNLVTRFPTTFVSQTGIADWEEILLMSACKNHVISNSTFSWWGAWLNPKHDKIVVAPKQWALKNNENYRNITPAGWIRV